MTPALRPKYAGLSRQQLLDSAYQLGFGFERYSHSCSQSTVAAMHEMFEMEDVVVRVSTSSAGGQAARVAGTCGGLVGGTVALDYFFGRPVEDLSYSGDRDANLAPLHHAVDIAGRLYDKFVAEYGSIICPHIQTRLYGRHFYIGDEEEMAKFEKAGGHGDSQKSCCNLVGLACRWTTEIIFDVAGLR